MPSQERPVRPLPLWLKGLGSVFAIWHLVAIGLMALEAQSGPWPAPPPMGISHQLGPQFARVLFNAGSEDTQQRSGFRPFHLYLRGLQMTNLVSNEQQPNAVYLSVELRDHAGKTFKTVKLPDDRANLWVRHRQSILVRGLSEDQPLPPPSTEKIPAVGAERTMIEFWEMTEPGVLRISKKPQNQVPANMPVHRPSEAAKILTETYLRHLCREYDAASAELVRHHRMKPMVARWILPGDPPPDEMMEIKSYFGVHRREQ